MVYVASPAVDIVTSVRDLLHYLRRILERDGIGSLKAACDFPDLQLNDLKQRHVANRIIRDDNHAAQQRRFEDALQLRSKCGAQLFWVRLAPGGAEFLDELG